MKLEFGDKVTWTERSSGNSFRAIFDFENKHGDAIILMHPDDFKKRGENCSYGHHDVDYNELKRGWVK